MRACLATQFDCRAKRIHKARNTRLCGVKEKALLASFRRHTAQAATSSLQVCEAWLEPTLTILEPSQTENPGP